MSSKATDCFPASQVQQWLNNNFETVPQKPAGAMDRTPVTQSDLLVITGVWKTIFSDAGNNYGTNGRKDINVLLFLRRFKNAASA